MLRFILRSLWRVVILLVGISLVWAAVRAYPTMDARLPAFIVLLLIYIFFAYFGVPTLIRLLRIFIKPNRIPLYVTTGDGWPSDPVNIAIITTDKNHLVRAMEKSGWHVADPITYKNSLHVITSMLFNMPYPAAPLSNLYLFNRPHDIGFEISTNKNKSARTRHHVRFWRLEEPIVHHDNVHHYAFWAEKLKHLLVPEKEMWIGAATEDTRAVDIQWHTGQLTHGGSHDSDKERDFIIDSLQQTKAVSKVYTSEPGEELRFRGQQIRTFYVSNGSIKIARLR